MNEVLERLLLWIITLLDQSLNDLLKQGFASS